MQSEWLFVRRGIYLCWLVVILFISNSSAQLYPVWFLNQGEVNCGKTVAGFAKPSFYADSSAAQAIRNGYETYAKQLYAQVSGGQAFWSTEIGTFWMGSNIFEQYDSAAVAIAKSQLAPLDTFATGEMTIVLLGQSSCSLAEPLCAKSSLQSLPAPAWTETPPQDQSYYYAVGVVPGYYYEISSWLQAELYARRNLARAVLIDVQSLQKMEMSGQEVRNEELAATLHDVQTVARWRDTNKRIFFVLVRMPKA